MRALDRKLFRDLRQMRGQVIAIGLVIASGVATFVMSLSTLRSLERTQESYYERHRFAQVFAHLKRAPIALRERMAEIPGVGRVETRVVAEVILDVPGLIEPAVGRLVSIPEGRRPGLNDLYLRQGRYIEPGRRGEVLVNEPFAEAHGLGPGDKLAAVLHGRYQELRIVGIALSPEFIYQIRPGDLFPDNERFGVFWMSERQLAPAFDLEGAFNDVALSMTRGASEREIIDRLDRLLEPYGGLGAYSREDQTSHRYVSDEISQLRVMALIPPAIFLGVAAFLLNVVLNRLISIQREQIAALKAFGYSSREVGWHYLKLALLVVAAGTILGTVVGVWLARGLTEIYAEFFRFPELLFEWDAGVILPAFGISCVAGGLGVAGAVRRAVELPPAEAMRPEPPGNYRPTLIERAGLQRFFSQGTRMILRQLERRPWRALLSVLGIALAVAVLVLGSFSVDMIDFLTEYQFYLSQRQEFSVGFVEPVSARAVGEMENLPGIMRAEPFRSVPVRLRSEHRSRRLAIMGLPRERELFRLLDMDLRPVPIPEEGLVISEKLAELLDIRVGERLTVEVMEGERPVREMAVAGLIRDFSGLAAYMELRALNRFMREGPAVSGVFLTSDRQQTEEMYRAIKRTPGVANISSQRAALASFHDTIAENMLRMRAFNVMFATIIAFGVVYNSARITLSERSRELATLRVIGFTRREISEILLGEVAVLTFSAIPLGLGLGYGFAALAIAGLQTETQRFPLVVSASTFGFAVAVTLAAALFSGLAVRRRLDHLDLIGVLKSRE